MSGLDDAASAALWMLALERDPAVEHIGALYDAGGAIARTEAADGKATGVRGGLRVPRGALRALFHNHPAFDREKADVDRARFSTDDRRQAQALGVPSYISAGHRLRRFDPSTGDTEDVLAEFPMDDFRAYLMRTLLNREPGDPRGLTR